MIAIVISFGLMLLSGILFSRDALTPVRAAETQRSIGKLTNLTVHYLDAQNSNLNAMIPNMPTNLMSPVNFAGGDVYVKMRVFNKPTTMFVQSQICMWGDNFTRETCSPAGTSFTANGTYYTKYPAPNTWWNNGNWGWDRIGDFLSFVHEDENTNPYWYDACGGACYPGPLDLHQHLPFNYDAEVILTVAGAAFARPADWADCPTSICGTGGPLPTSTTAPVSPTVTTNPTNNCPASKPKGDANCDGVPTLVDYQIWRNEFKGTVTTKTADFNGDGVPTLVDYQIWRTNFIGNMP